MLSSLTRLFYEWSQKKAFEEYLNVNEQMIIYSESYNYWPHFEGIVKHLWEDFGERVIYLTSDREDRILLFPPEGVTAFCIGQGAVRTAVFAGLRAKLVIMTMPDLETYYIKRSARVMHYAYIFHSINSCHMVYGPHAFDYYDSIFCVGPHQISEIRALEARNKSPEKQVIRHGYGRLESLSREAKEGSPGYADRPSVSAGKAPVKILIAPSWGKHSLIERLGANLIGPLLKAGFDIVLRPHPETLKRSPQLILEIFNRYGQYRNFKLEKEVASKESLLAADIMISDYSGAAIEFAFSRLKPVLFVDVPPKVNNPDYAYHSLEPLEVSIRKEIGMILAEDKVSVIDTYVHTILDNYAIYVENILKAREKYIFNFGNSGVIGAKALLDIFNTMR